MTLPKSTEDALLEALAQDDALKAPALMYTWRTEYIARVRELEAREYRWAELMSWDAQPLEHAFYVVRSEHGATAIAMHLFDETGRGFFSLPPAHAVLCFGSTPVRVP